MPRFKLKAFDPHNPDVAARRQWEKLQRGETKHKYDLPPTQPGKRKRRSGAQPSQSAEQQAGDERLSLNQRRFQVQVQAAKGGAVQRPRSAPDTEARDKRTIRKDRKAKKTAEERKEEESSRPSAVKRKREASAEEVESEEQHTRAQWEEKVASIKRKQSGSSGSSSATADAEPTPPQPPPAPPREFAGVEKIPFGFQIDRPPQHLTQLKNKRAAAAQGSQTGGKLSMEQYVAERQKAQEAYAEMRKRRRDAEKT